MPIAKTHNYKFDIKFNSNYYMREYYVDKHKNNHMRIYVHGWWFPIHYKVNSSTN